jgi:hypothetical protein
MRCLLLLGVLATGLSTVSVKDCSSGTSVFRVNALSFAPDSPIGGQNGTLHSVYTVPDEYNAGTARYSCSINGLPVYDESFELCSQTSCPITVGTHDDYSISEVPDVSGKVSCKIEWTDLSHNQLLCIQTVMILTSISEKKNLRGKSMTLKPLGFGKHKHIFDNRTCPLVEDYDPSRTVQENVEPFFHSHEETQNELAKKSLIALRSGTKML